MKRLALILTLTVTSAATIAAPSAAQQGGQDQYNDPFAWKKCATKVTANLKITAARSMRCKSARRVMRRYDGSISRNFKTEGFSCKLVRGRPISGIWRCKKGRAKAFRFAFGD